MPNIAYISPKLLSALKTKTMQPKHNTIKSDVFALGMTLLEAATLQNVGDCYDN